MRLALTIAALAALAAAGPAAAAPRATPSPRVALARAQAALSGSPLAPAADATLALRDLSLVRDRLSGAAAKRADGLLARPDDPGSSTPGDVRYTVPSTMSCTEHFCVHYVRTSTDAPPPRDTNRNGVPDQVDTTAGLLEFLWAKEVVEYGFRPPKSDLVLANHGPDARFDVYLADIVDQGVLGFCAPEPPASFSSWDVPGYCVLDNDYSPAQIGAPGLGGIHELELTAVHEFFHAIQFNYDFADDRWLLEGTATWIEDSVYDSFNEPYRRFPYSPLRQPAVPIDFASPSQPYQYGSWVFWRWLEERLAPRATHVDPHVIRRVWEYADGSPGARDLYSIEAAAATLAERGVAFRSAWLQFAVDNFLPASFYREGRSWPASPVTRSTPVAARSTTARRALELDHLTARYVAFTPGRNVGRAARLTLRLDLPPPGSGGAAAMVVQRQRGAARVTTVPLSGAGNATVRVPFGRGSVSRVVLVLANASKRFVCGRFGTRTVYSCGGTPVDDGRRYAYSASVG